MAAGLRVQVLDRVPQRGARHRACVPVEEFDQASGVALAGFADPSADRLLHQVLRVIGQDVGDGERVVQVVLPDEEVRGHDRAPPLPPVGGSGKDVQRIAWLVGEVPTDHIRSGAIDQVPRVDAIVAA